MKETCWKLQNRPPQVHMVTQSSVNQGGMTGSQQWAPFFTSPSNGTQSSTGLNTQVIPHHPQDLRIQSLQQQMQNIQQQLQGLQVSCGACTSSGSIIGSTSLANSGKTSILSALSTISSMESHQSSWILDSGAIDHMTPIIDLFASG